MLTIPNAGLDDHSKVLGSSHRCSHWLCMIKTTHHPKLMTGSLETAGAAHVIACLKVLVLE